MSTPEFRRVERLIGVYHADGGVLGELRYAVGKISGRTDCALCDLTHRRLRPSPEWAACQSRVGVPVDLVHLNQRTAEVRAATDGRTPCVLADVEGELLLLLGPDDLAACDGDVERFEAALKTAAAGQHLHLGRPAIIPEI